MVPQPCSCGAASCSGYYAYQFFLLVVQQEPMFHLTVAAASHGTTIPSPATADTLSAAGWQADLVVQIPRELYQPHREELIPSLQQEPAATPSGIATPWRALAERRFSALLSHFQASPQPNGRGACPWPWQELCWLPTAPWTACMLPLSRDSPLSSCVPMVSIVRSAWQPLHFWLEGLVLASGVSRLFFASCASKPLSGTGHCKTKKSKRQDG